MNCDTKAGGFSVASDNAGQQVFCKTSFSGPSLSPVLLLIQLDKQLLVRSTLQHNREFRKRVSVTFSEQVLQLLSESRSPVARSVPVPPGLREKVIPKLRCLQKVVERCPKSVFITEGYSTTYYVEKLVCGHEVFTFPQAHSLTARRRNCIECARVGGSVEGDSRRVPLPPSFPKKKPNESVHSATESEVISLESRMG
jgi:hypothetical protein